MDYSDITHGAKYGTRSIGNHGDTLKKGNAGNGKQYLDLTNEQFLPH